MHRKIMFHTSYFVLLKSFRTEWYLRIYLFWMLILETRNQKYKEFYVTYLRSHSQLEAKLALE